MFRNHLAAAAIGTLTLLSSPLDAQDKVILGVGEITSTISNANPGNFQTMLETVLVQTNKFEIIERSRLDQILGERGLGMAGITDRTDGLSGIEGVDYLIYGSITKLGESEKQSNFGIAGLNKKDKNYEMAVDLRIVDVDSARIVMADTVEMSSKSSGHFTVGGLAGYGVIGQSGSEGDPLSDIQRMTAVEVAGAITMTINPIKVAAVQSDGTIMLNYGDSVLVPGSLVRVFRIGEGFIDPDTGEVLGQEEQEIGVLRVDDALAKFSKSSLAAGELPAVGDLVRKMNEDETKATEKQLKKAKRG